MHAEVSLVPTYLYIILFLAWLAWFSAFLFRKRASGARHHVTDHDTRSRWFTGGLIGPLDEPISLAGDLAGTPVLLSSGDPDPHVPWKRVQQSGELLTSIGAKVTLKRYPGRPHTVLPEEIEQGKKLLSISLA